MPADTMRRPAVINFAKKFDLLSEQWQPKVVAELNDYQFKVVRITRKPTRRSSFSTANCASISEIDPLCWRPGEMFVVPKGTEHKPFAEKEVRMLLIEPRGTLNTGHEGGERTAQNDSWI
jgi:hypothetical protein